LALALIPSLQFNFIYVVDRGMNFRQLVVAPSSFQLLIKLGDRSLH
jgi:hypothetical protein